MGGVVLREDGCTLYFGGVGNRWTELRWMKMGMSCVKRVGVWRSSVCCCDGLGVILPGWADRAWIEMYMLQL